MTTCIVQSPAAARAAAGLPGAAIDVGMSDEQMARFQLEALFGRHRGSLIELRAKAPGVNGMQQVWLSLPRTAATAAMERAHTHDIYVGVLPRTERGGGKVSVVDKAHVVWAECDTEAAVGRALDFHIPPHLFVRSSPGKAHCYWFLRDAVPKELIERANRRLCFALGADKAATDCARILRVAGTRNHKYGISHRVAITRVGQHLNVAAGDLLDRLPDPAPPRPLPPLPSAMARRQQFGPDADKDRLLEVPARVYIEALSGRGVARDMACCPFHKGGQERTPSLHVGGPNDTLWHCFGCGEGGDIFTFAARLWGLDDRRDFPTIKTKLGEARL